MRSITDKSSSSLLMKPVSFLKKWKVFVTWKIHAVKQNECDQLKTSEVFATGLPLEVYRQCHKTQHAAHYVGTKKFNKLDDSKKLAVLKKVNRDRKS